MTEIRTERTHGMKDRLSARQRAELVAVVNMAGYEALLDLMEMACIEQESKLINSPVEDQNKIFEEFRLSKAFWQIFTGMQKRVLVECNAQRSEEDNARYLRETERGKPSAHEFIEQDE